MVGLLLLHALDDVSETLVVEAPGDGLASFWLGGSRVKVKSRSPAFSRLSATARHLSRHFRRKALRRFSICAAVAP
jgi:hypothetical protein